MKLRNMKFVLRSALVAALVVMTACVKETPFDFDGFEDQTLEAWIIQNRPELLGNKQQFDEASYYIDILDAGDPAQPPISDTACWVRFNFTGRDTRQNIILTRNAAEAKLLGSFTKQTHYVPYYRFCGEETSSMPVEGSYLALRKKQTLGEEYWNRYKNDPERRLPGRELDLRVGSKVRIYMPSRIVGTGGLAGDGGYEGQYSLSSQRPLIVDMEVTERVKNPLAAEADAVDEFCKANGGLQIYTAKKADDSSAEPFPLPTKDFDSPNHPYNIAADWSSASDSVAHVYVNYRYKPGYRPADKQLPVTFEKPYYSGYAPYVTSASMEELERKIDAVLLKRFHTDKDLALYDDVRTLEADSIGQGSTAKIWYIGRFLDGFIFDTNIDEVKDLIYDSGYSEGSVLSYIPSDGGMIQAFFHSVPNLKYGQWAMIITASANAYGSSGKTGTTSTSSSSSGYASSYYDYLNYLSYYNNYYGNSYGGYYNDYYGGYGGYGGYYGGYYSPYYGYGYNDYYGYGYDSSTGTSTETTSATSTEILPFTPLLFQVYLEPEE